MKFFFTIVAALIFIKVNAQSFSQADVTGIWVCTEVKELPSRDWVDPDLKSSLGILKKAYLGSTFTFGADGKFSETLTKTSQDFTEMLNFLNGRNWYFESVTKRISIGKPSENLMHIDVTTEKNFVYFTIYELPLRLKVEKKQAR